MGGSWLRVRCLECGHHWIAVKLPMELGKIAELLGSLHCPACAADASRIVTAS